MFPTPPPQKLLYLVHGFNDIPSKFGTKYLNPLENNGVFNFSHVQRVMKQNIKITKNQLTTPINHSMIFCCAFVFSVRSTRLNVQFLTYFKICKKIDILSNVIIHRGRKRVQ